MVILYPNGIRREKLMGDLGHWANPESPILGDYCDYGCQVNAIRLDDLFKKYRQADFLYDDKVKRLEPYWDLICNNWKRALRGGELIHYIVTAEVKNAWASLSSWRSTNKGWNTQHLVGLAGPSASRAAMLSTQAVRIHDQLDRSHQNWFQRSNRFANKVFGSIESTLGGATSWVGDYSYFMVPLSQAAKNFGKSNDSTHDVTVRQIAPGDSLPLRLFAEQVRSSVYVAAEELDSEDLMLESVDDLYRKVGLRRFRRILISDCPNVDQPAGIAIAYRGPLGMNFSFLENRCDLLINPLLSPQQRQAVIFRLLAESALHYADFEPQAIPVVVAPDYGSDLQALGGEYIRDYAQSVWLQEGYEMWYRHVEGIYARVMRASERIGSTDKTMSSNTDDRG